MYHIVHIHVCTTVYCNYHRHFLYIDRVVLCIIHYTVYYHTITCTINTLCIYTCIIMYMYALYVDMTLTQYVIFISYSYGIQISFNYT